MKRQNFIKSIAVGMVLFGLLINSTFFSASLSSASLSVEANTTMTGGQEQFPPDMPNTPYPDIKGCSASQESYLKKAWRLAHYYTWRADKLMDYILSQPESQRDELWNRDYVADQNSVMPSPRKWFGPYNSERAQRVREAIDKARKRFENKGEIVKGIRTLRCGSPIAPGADEHTDVCPSSNIGGNGGPTAYHAPVGVIVTCPSFWDNGGDLDTRLSSSARILVHEIFHWLSTDGKYVTDLHGGTKYYGKDKCFYLAENKPGWAIYNNDSYAWFIYYVGRYEPSFSAVWGEKEPGGTGGFFIDMSWEGLVAMWKKLGDTQYLADVETYVRNGERKYAAVWRVGKGNGALYGAPWSDFEKQYLQLKKTQDLIDIEIYKSGDTWMYLGVYRVKQDKAAGDGGLLVGLTWDELVNKWKQFANVAYLADVETYVNGNKREFIAVWRAGKGNGALYSYKSWAEFDNIRKQNNNTQQLIDFEKFLSADGKWNYLGVWRAGKPSGPILQSLSMTELLDEWNKRKANNTLLSIEEYSALPARIK